MHTPVVFPTAGIPMHSSEYHGARAKYQARVTRNLELGEGKTLMPQTLPCTAVPMYM